MEAELLEKIITELSVELTGGVIKLAHQPDERTIVLRIFARGKESRLIISTHPGFCRLHITTARPVNPAVPKRFCALLRARLTGARLTGIEHLTGERIVHLCFEKKRFEKDGLEERETGGIKAYTLVVELTGKSANAILVDSEGIVLDALRYFRPGLPSGGTGAARVVEPGVFLKPLKPKPATLSKSKSLVERVGHESWNRAADRFYTALVNENREELERSRLRRSINKARKKAVRKVENLLSDKEAALKGKEQSRFGELLSANRHKIKRGAKSVEADDYTVVPPVKVEVELNEKLGPQENIERYFKRARKAKRTLKLLDVRLPGAEREVEYLDSLLYGLATAVTEEELADFKEELIVTGFIKKEPKDTMGRRTEKTGVSKEAEKRAQRPEPFRRYTSGEGFAVLCGKSGSGNDRIVKREAAGEDIWFHAKGVPGSHVLIKVAGRGKELTRATLEEAAALAAFYSKAKGSGLVEVIYAEARHVKKPRGAKPGSVTVREFRSLKVRPKEMPNG